MYLADVIWNRQPTARIFVPEHTPLLIDMRDGEGMVMDSDKVRRFVADEQARWGVLAAWVSSARRPSEEELQSFLGMPGQGLISRRDAEIAEF